MSLEPGTHLGPYEITTPLGAGGMGEVYRARDKRLERTVAIKVLPREVSANADRKQRFEREARTISSLNHPNICALYDVGSQDGIDYLVLEFVDGETLEKRLERGPLPKDVLLRHGMEIADALEKAHRSGVIHRDLKPANIMLTKSGAKLLDFGLAKWSAAAASEEEILKTLTARATKLTEEGTILGTFQYMAPEQLEGKEADARTDLFAFGVVLYEMATARPAFAGKTKASLIAAILSAEPTPIATLQPMTPPALERLVRGCLEKDPDERWQTAHDIKLQLRAVAEGGSTAGVPAPVMARRKSRERILLAALAVMAMAAGLLGILYVRRTPEEARVVRASIKPAPNTVLSLIGPSRAGFAVSPDGLRLAYTATSAEGKVLLWVRPIDSLQAQLLPGTEGAGYPFWSPDNRFIGFFAGGRLKKVDATGGPPLTLCDAINGRGGTWNREGVILFAPTTSSPVHRVPAAGGEPTPITTLDQSKNVQSHRWPFFLPDGRHFLYVAGGPFSSQESPTNTIMVGSLDSKESKALFRNYSNAIYASGRIVFLREHTLMAQPFDAKNLELTGDALPIADLVQQDEGRIVGLFSASQNGVLTYVEGSSGADRQLIWVNRSGNRVGDVPGADAYDDGLISPDGKTVLFTLSSSGSDIWTYDLARGVKTRLTFGAASAQANNGGVWSPDGRRVAYTSLRGGKFGIYQRAADGSGGEEIVVSGDRSPMYANDWSPDGKILAFYTSNSDLGGFFELWMAPLGGSAKPYPFLQGQFSQLGARFSPDGKFVTYFSTESGRPEVYVVRFPGPGGKWQVSNGGGTWPRWGQNGKEIFYLSPDSKIMASEVKNGGAGFEVGAGHALFETRPYRTGGATFDVAPDSQRFLIDYSLQQPNTAITLVVNWDAELRKK
jgi:serine/threonine protein kinase/Tol biopolymer transport system component